MSQFIVLIRFGLSVVAFMLLLKFGYDVCLLSCSGVDRFLSLNQKNYTLNLTALTLKPQPEALIA